VPRRRRGHVGRQPLALETVRCLLPAINELPDASVEATAPGLRPDRREVRPRTRATDPVRGPVPNRHDGAVAFLPKVLGRRLGPVGVALTVYDVWRHLPAKQREQLVEQSLKHGTRAGRFVASEGSKQLRKLLG